MVGALSDDAITIRAADLPDAAAIAAIYNHYVSHTFITFEEENIDARELARRLQDVRSVSLPWLVAEVENQIVGYAYASPWRARSAYRFTAEITVYVAPGHAGRGIGSALYGQLTPILRE